MAELKEGLKIRDRYVLREYKGSGSFGEVWKAYDEMVGAEVAIKIYISLDERGVEEFRDEYRATIGIQHENLLITKHFDIWEHRPFLIMKFCEQGSATTLIEKADETTLWRFIHDVAAGLDYLHSLEEPMIHQDIKPDNILIGPHGRFLITDFGISRRLRSTMRKQSKRAVAAGATSYMGPERFEENPMPVKASDIWSLGASIYEIATGELPFSGMGGVMQKNGAARPRLSGQWSEDLNMVMRSCLAADTWNRPKASELEAFAAAKLRGENPGPTWKTDTSVSPQTVAQPPVEIEKPASKVITTSNEHPTNNHPKRRSMLWIAVAAVGVIIGVVLAVVLTNNSSTTDPGNVAQDSTANVQSEPVVAQTDTVAAEAPASTATDNQADAFAVAKKSGDVAAIRKLAQSGYAPAQQHMASLANSQFKAGNYTQAESYAKAAGAYGKSVRSKIAEAAKTGKPESKTADVATDKTDQKGSSAFETAKKKGDDATIMRLAAGGDAQAQDYMARKAEQALKAGNYQQAKTFAKAAGAKGKPVLEKLKKIRFE